MIHGGVFVPRQYTPVAGIVHGRKTHDFLGKISRADTTGRIRSAPSIGAASTTSHSSRSTPPIGERDNRPSKAHVARPDGAAVNAARRRCWRTRTFTWLGTERDKYATSSACCYARVEPQEFPHLRFGREPQLTVRYFPDKLPIGVQADRTEHVFLYLVTSQLRGGLQTVSLYARQSSSVRSRSGRSVCSSRSRS